MKMNDFPPLSTGRYALKLLLLLVLLWTAGCEEQPEIPRLDPGSTVLAFGDSLTYGTGAARETAYPQTLESLLSVNVVNAGVPGEISSEGLERLPGELKEHRPALVILCHGGNDMLRRRSLEKLAENIRAMIETCRAAGAHVILVGVPQPGFTLEPPALYATIAEEYDIPYADGILTDLLTDRDYKSDTIHLNAAGYRRLAEALSEMIRVSSSS
ncbi:MAG: arylesterase [Desulfuromonadales bacterium]